MLKCSREKFFELPYKNKHMVKSQTVNLFVSHSYARFMIYSVLNKLTTESTTKKNKRISWLSPWIPKRCYQLNNRFGVCQDKLATTFDVHQNISCNQLRKMKISVRNEKNYQKNPQNNKKIMN